MVSGINLLGDGATQTFAAAAATRATTSTNSRIPLPSIKGRDVALDEEWPNGLASLHKMLCKYIEKQVQNKILIPPQEAFEAGGTEKLTDVVEAALGVETSARMKGVATSPLKRRILDAVRHIGELTSKATRRQRLLMQQEYDVDAGSATYGMKLDLQCRAEEHELNNSEFKVDDASEEQVEVQYRKNLRVN
ncbi:hypothetical protein KI688_012926 [Linnemannia hyalina]|uniref:Uncharacterized protein n=1 Tax=Linnemannia hyalina TaxID=64524 RepID=A0A9P8BSE2_9FUNG|nr:hypothetical protein KI688_012926 [Linnemannia hyalina]